MINKDGVDRNQQYSWGQTLILSTFPAREMISELTPIQPVSPSVPIPTKRRTISEVSPTNLSIKEERTLFEQAKFVELFQQTIPTLFEKRPKKKQEEA